MSSIIKLLFGGDRHIRELFERYLFSAAKLHSRIEATVNLCLQDRKNAENKMVVNLQADLERLPLPSGTVGFNEAEWAKAHQQLLQALSQRLHSELPHDVFREICNILITDAIVVAFRALAVRLGILGTGAASGMATFGVGLLVAIVIDWIWDAATDPVGKLAAELRQCIDDIQIAILYGQGGKYGGLLHQLSDLQAARARMRQQALNEFFSRYGIKP